MDPQTLAALISGGAALGGGLMGQQYQAEQLKKQRIADAQNLGYQAQAQGIGAMGASQQNAMNQLLQSYKSALV